MKKKLMTSFNKRKAVTFFLFFAAAFSFCFGAERQNDNNRRITRQIKPQFYPRGEYSGEMRNIFTAQLDANSILALYLQEGKDQSSSACFVYCNRNADHPHEIFINPKHALATEGYAFNGDGSLFCWLSKQDGYYDLLTFAVGSFNTFRLHRIDSFFDETFLPVDGKKSIFFSESTLCVSSLKSVAPINKLVGNVYALKFLNKNWWGSKCVAHVSAAPEEFMPTIFIKKKYEMRHEDIVKESFIWNSILQKYQTITGQTQ
jgi:hypothetical protein